MRAYVDLGCVYVCAYILYSIDFNFAYFVCFYFVYFVLSLDGHLCVSHFSLIRSIVTWPYHSFQIH